MERALSKYSTRQSWLLLLTGAYCVTSVMMNYLCMKPLNFGTNFIWMDGGLLVSWLVFMISDILVEVYGKRVAMMVTSIAAAIVLLMSVIASLEVLLPTLPAYADQAEHFAYIFSNGPRTILSSVAAFWLGNMVNVELMARSAKLRFWIRVVIATLLGQIVDNATFQILAFAPIGLSLFEMRWQDIWTAIGMSTAFETMVEALLVPILTLPLVNYLKKLAC